VLKGERPIATGSWGNCRRTSLQQLIVEVWETIRAGGVVLLGEVHDNPEHHAARADILWPRLQPMLVTRDLRPAAVFEHIRVDQQGQIETFYERAAGARRPWGAPDLLRLLGWKDSGWPPADTFYPLFDAALWARMPVLPGNTVRERMRAIVRDPSAADATETARLDLAGKLPEPLLAELKTELAGAHCGVLPEQAVRPMAMAQRYTDAYLAEKLVAAADAWGGAFLLAGNGHVRSDRGVPWYVRQLSPGKKVASVLLLEVEPGAGEAASYLPRAPDGSAAADYILFTPRHPRPDPCGKMPKRRR
jgi:uncharacterized iron-regulated protein